jgi:hypothetical protein
MDHKVCSRLCGVRTQYRWCSSGYTIADWLLITWVSLATGFPRSVQGPRLDHPVGCSLATYRWGLTMLILLFNGIVTP